MACVTYTCYVDNDTVVELDALKNAALDSFINNATVSLTVVTAAGAEVGGQSWPVTMLYVADSDGRYRGTIDAGAAITEGNVYTAQITVSSGGLDGYWELALSATARTA